MSARFSAAPMTVVDFLIPSHAMSAGTILAMSGDAIHMDYYSVLGPIDPQVENQEGRLIPALGYLIRYEDLLEKANSGNITAAELNILLNFDQGDLYRFTQARDLSISLLEEWLVKYKFKDWTTTETHGDPVSLEMKKIAPGRSRVSSFRPIAPKTCPRMLSTAALPPRRSIFAKIW